MHELSIASDIISRVCEFRDKNYPNAAITRIKVEIGPLAGVDPDSLAFVFPIAAAEGTLKDTKLDIAKSKISLICSSCGKISMLETMEWLCPLCESGEIRIEGGKEMSIQNIEIENTEKNNV
jgi:hydrogenase nickel incorporation protein HypA/HybF